MKTVTVTQPLERFRGPPHRQIKLLKKVDLTQNSFHMGWFREKQTMKGYMAWVYEDGEVYFTKPGLLSEVDILCHLTRMQLEALISTEQSEPTK